jgi:tRNA-binding EMAP/Myf-like protein
MSFTNWIRFVPLEEMQNRDAIILCNLKPSKMRDIMSEAMVMCASTPEKVGNSKTLKAQNCIRV